MTLEEDAWDLEQRQKGLASTAARLEVKFNGYKEFQDEWSDWKTKTEQLEKDVWALIEKVEGK